MDNTLIFIGAGFTAALGIPTTETQKKLFMEYFFDKNVFIEKYQNILGSESVKKLLEAQNACEADSFSSKLLCEYVRHFFSRDSFSIQNLYNLLYMQINTGMTYGSFSHVDLLHIRSEMLVLLQYIFSIYTENTLNDKGKIKAYIDFFKSNAQYVLSVQIEKIQAGIDIASTDFVISPLSYISLSWDVLFIWMMFQAHKSLNDSNNNHIVFNGKNLKIKIFNDFSVYLATKALNDSASEKWFPYNEPVAAHINDKDHLSDKCVSLIKTYLPHGQTNWLECPRCGKLSMYLGNSWDINSDSIVMKQGQPYRCIHCQNELTTENSAMLIQTIYKDKSSYIQEIQTDMHLQIKKAERIIFIGYSLPEDDVDYRSIFTSLCADSILSKVYVVLFDKNASDIEWVDYDYALKLPLEESTKSEICRYKNIFSNRSLKFTFCGFPNASNLITELLR